MDKSIVFTFLILVLGFGKSLGQCSPSGLPAPEVTLVITTSNQTTPSADGVDSGSMRVYTGFYENNSYTISLDNAPGNLTCRHGQFLDASNNLLGSSFNISSTTTQIAPANTAKLLVTTTRTGPPSVIQANLTYRINTTTSSPVVISGTAQDEDCPSDNDGTITGVDITNELSGIQYIRLTQQRTSATHINLRELEAFEVLTGTNVALNKNVTSNVSALSGYAISNLTDGQIDNTTSGLALTVPGSFGNWMQVDLSSEHRLDFIRIYNRTNCCTNRSDNLLLEYFDSNFHLLYSTTIDASAPVTDFNVLDVSWNDAGASLNRTGLNTGTYTLNYSDILGNTHSQDFTVGVNKTESSPASSISSTISDFCEGTSSTLSIVGGSLGTNASWEWYSGGCGGTHVGSGTSVSVSPTDTTTYFVRAEGDCNTTSCASVTIDVSADPQVTISVNDTEACQGGFIMLTADVIEAGTGSATFRWQFANQPSGPWINTGPNSNSHSVLVNDTTYFRCSYYTSGIGCDTSISNVVEVNVEPDPIKPTLDTATPANGSTLCANQDVSATTNPGSGGIGTCSDEYRYSIDGGGSWSSYTPGNSITTGVNGTSVIIQARRVCDGNGCDGIGEIYSTIASWNVVDLPPNAVCNNDTVYLSYMGGSAIDINRIDNGSSDDCELSIILDKQGLDCNHIGTNTITLTASDEGGNVSTCNSTITVLDTIKPNLICPSDTEIVADIGQCGAVFNFTAPTDGSFRINTGVIETGPALPTSGGSTNWSAVAYNPIDSLYYAMRAGNTGMPFRSYDHQGNQLNQTTTGFDFRGLWWNPNTNTLQGNGIGSSGYRNVNLDANQYVTNTGTNFTTGPNQPNNQSCGAYDFHNNEIVFYHAARLYSYDMQGNQLTNRAIVNFPEASTGAITTRSVGYCGVPGAEIIIYSELNARVYFIDKATATYNGVFLDMPAGAPTPNNYGFTYANGYVFLREDASNNPWESYKIVIDDRFDNCDSTSVVQTGGPSSGSVFPPGVSTIEYTATDASGNIDVCSYNVTVRKRQSIEVFGNNTLIANGDAWPSFDDSTFFETIFHYNQTDVNTFTIENSGTEALSISSIGLIGDAEIWMNPIGAVSVPAGGSYDFEISFEPSFCNTGSYYSTVLIVSDDCEHPNYTFGIGGLVSNTVDSTSTLSSVTDSAICDIDDMNWHHFYSESGMLLGSINSNGEDLGEVNFKIEVGDNGPVGSGFGSAICSNPDAVGGEYTLARHWDISVENQPTNPVDVRFYYLGQEVTNLIDTINAQPTTYINCWGDVNAETDLMMTVIHSNDSTEVFPNIGSTVMPGPGTDIRMIEFQLSEFSSGFLHSNGGIYGVNALPVELLDFQAMPIDNRFIKVAWKTATEINNERFELYRSKDGMHFDLLTTIAGSGNSTEVLSYTYDDYDVQVGTYYYYLKQVDYDGNSETFDIVSASIQGENSVVNLKLRPNPASSEVYIELTSLKNQPCEISVLDMHGREVLASDFHLTEGENTLQFEDLDQLPVGTYYVFVKTGEASLVEKLVLMD